jgi:hypothetical protein
MRNLYNLGSMWHKGNAVFLFLSLTFNLISSDYAYECMASCHSYAFQNFLLTVGVADASHSNWSS